MATYLKNVQVGAEDIKRAVFDLAFGNQTQLEREIQREIILRALIIAQHTNSNWAEFKGR